MSDVRYSGRKIIPEGDKGVESETTAQICRSKKELKRALETQ
jgi:hypothetical protein